MGTGAGRHLLLPHELSAVPQYEPLQQPDEGGEEPPGPVAPEDRLDRVREVQREFPRVDARRPQHRDLRQVDEVLDRAVAALSVHRQRLRGVVGARVVPAALLGPRGGSFRIGDDDGVGARGAPVERVRVGPRGARLVGAALPAPPALQGGGVRRAGAAVAAALRGRRARVRGARAAAPPPWRRVLSRAAGDVRASAGLLRCWRRSDAMARRQGPHGVLQGLQRVLQQRGVELGFGFGFGGRRGRVCRGFLKEGLGCCVLGIRTSVLGIRTSDPSGCRRAWDVDGAGLLVKRHALGLLGVVLHHHHRRLRARCLSHSGGAQAVGLAHARRLSQIRGRMVGQRGLWGDADGPFGRACLLPRSGGRGNGVLWGAGLQWRFRFVVVRRLLRYGCGTRRIVVLRLERELLLRCTRSEVVGELER